MKKPNKRHIIKNRIQRLFMKERDFPITRCEICEKGKNTEKIFKSLETGKNICFTCLRSYDLLHLLNPEMLGNEVIQNLYKSNTKEAETLMNDLIKIKIDANETYLDVIKRLVEPFKEKVENERK